MIKLDEHIRKRTEGRRKILSVFLTAGYPRAELTVPLISAAAEAGADVVELGIPFSDPIADGPVIQQSSAVALKNGIHVDDILRIAEAAGKQAEIPIVLMTYMNSVFTYGLERFLVHSREAGVSGTIIADLPLEASASYRSIAARESISTIFLAAPTTPDERIRRLDEASSGFLYCVSITGVTGEREVFAEQSSRFLHRVRACVKKNRVLVGFGISTASGARSMAGMSDGVIVGSAVLSKIAGSPGKEVEAVASFVGELRSALDSGD